MVHEDWLSEIEKGAFELELINLRLSYQGGEEFEGQGYLRWEEGSGLRVDATTGGSEKAFRTEVPKIAGKQGYPFDSAMSLVAATPEGSSVTSERIWPHGVHIRPKTGVVSWRFPDDAFETPVTIVDQHRPFPTSVPSVVSLLLKPCQLSSWPRWTETKTDNPHFRLQGSVCDWLEVDTQFGRIAAQERPNKCIALKAYIKEENDDATVRAVNLAFSFLAGRPAGVLASHRRGRDRTRRVIHPRVEERDGIFLPPLRGAQLMKWGEPLLAKAVDFFSTELGEAIGQLLEVCWDTVDNRNATVGLVNCAVLEGLIGELAEEQPREAAIDATQRESLIDFARKEGFPSRFVARLSGFLSGMDRIRVEDVLHRWAGSSFLEVTEADVRAWKSIRHSAAHGDLGDGAADDSDATTRIINLINKLVLQAMRYDGEYYDWAEEKSRAFPLAESLAS